MLEEYLAFIINQLDSSGFLGTRASLFIDIIVSFLVMLPLLSGISIFLAIRKHLKLHQVTQLLLFLLTLAFLGIFAYIVHYREAFDLLLQESSVDRATILVLLVVHAFIASVTLVFWFFVLIYALSDRRRRALPGLYSESHKKAGKCVFTAIALTASSSVSIYWVLFVG
ncbi:MAG: Unknown protein [uncultured Sulfurovum sp.]|uniref:DUF420 domain-containing protein n=1 Tax=uncultured Sulfurovum sp. TaxID=269237 RepID=A0A6S6S3B1_9BACT|nr:MAG: Unknown protein [uncultured Sulfurovum sp.]